MLSPEAPAAGVSVIPVAVRYHDLGPAGHVNNVASLRIIEEARRTFLGRPVTPGTAGGLLAVVPPSVRHVVRRQDIDYRDELWYQSAPFEVATSVVAVGRTSFRLLSEIRVSAAAAPAVVVEAIVVLVDPGTGRPWPIPAQTGRLLARGGRL